MLTATPLPTFTKPARHPARYSVALLPVMAQYLQPHWRVLDPFGGVGGLAKLAHTGTRIVIGELEFPIIQQAAGKRRVNANAVALPFADDSFDAIATSPTYGNRMADTYTDDSRRNTYTAAFGFALHPQNSGAIQWGPRYRILHRTAWDEAARVLKPRGLFVLNISNHIRDGREINVAAWHCETLKSLGLHLQTTHTIPTPRNRYGANGEKRAPCEYIFVFQKL
mgnify:CR=1 FL=1